MFALERMLGKDAMSVVCKELHQMCVQELNAEFYFSCVKVDGDFIIWQTTNDGLFFAYNFRQPDQLAFFPISNKLGHKVADLPKNY